MLQGNWCHVGAVIGRGGNASVRRLSSPFWLKAVVKTGVQGQLRREGNMMGCVHHPAVARVFALLREHKSEPNNKKKGYLVMEKLGASLLVALDQLTGRMPLLEALSICWQLASALDWVHRMKLVHHDLHPGNLLKTLDKKGYRLSDFGSAAWMFLPDGTTPTCLRQSQ
jgi:serine/threonine protein kinase